MCTLAVRRNILGGFALCAASIPGHVSGQTMEPSFTITGEIEAFTLDTPGNPVSAAKMTVSNIPVTLPTNLLVTMPGKYMTPHDLFLDAGGAMQAASGLALSDPVPPKIAFEAEIIGNIVAGDYIAGVVHISQGALHSGAGFIQQIDYATGEMRIGAKGGAAGARVRLNDVTGVYGLRNNEGAKAALAMDARFELDPENSPVHAKTGFPVCVPRSDPAIADDPKCPSANRPVGTDAYRFTCVRTAGEAAASGDAPAHLCNPDLPILLRVDDYVTYAGVLQPDPAGGFLISAYGLDAELGVYTSPGAEPVYVFIEEALQGTKGERFPDIPQEETTRFRIVGFSTDPTRSVDVRIADSDRGNIGFSFSGPAGLSPSNGPQLGRFRNTWPSKDNARAVRRDVEVAVTGSPHAVLPTGLTSGSYTAPISEYIYPEITTFGVPGYPSPVSFENFCFLTNAGGTFIAASGPVALSSPSPFPASGHPLSQEIGAGPGRVCDGQ
jgi:hypothetical protein